MPPRRQPSHAALIRALLLETRTRRGLTQEDLGALLEVSPVTIREWERGGAVPRPQSLRRVVAFLCSEEEEERAPQASIDAACVAAAYFRSGGRCLSPADALAFVCELRQAFS